jgi:hypothetical protein
MWWWQVFVFLNMVIAIILDGYTSMKRGDPAATAPARSPTAVQRSRLAASSSEELAACRQEQRPSVTTV